LIRLNTEEFKAKEKIPLVVVLDNIRSQHNVGAIFRTADAFLIEKIYLCGITATPPNREIHKTALGATDSVDWEYFEKTIDVIAQLKNRGFSIFALEQSENSVSLSTLSKLPTPVVLVVGNEIDGVSDEVMALADGVLEIPQFGTKHSLNVSVSAGIAIWEISKMFCR
jgi:tRNA G18 (ribose-2'-O)-methylase SpoU